MSQPPEGSDAWLDGCPAHLRAPLLRCARGDTPPNVVLMQLLAEAAEPSQVKAALACVREAADDIGSAAAAPLSAMLALAPSITRSYEIVKAVLGSVDHDMTACSPDQAVAQWAAAFDRAARLSPEGSVALYALGDPDLLRAATGEVIETMRVWSLLGPERAVLEIGCGIGRFPAALASEVGQVIGVDISGAMIAAAQKRCAGLRNVHVLQSSGKDLAAFPDASLDLVFAADSFPYLVQSGMSLVEKHFAEAARVLRPSGHLLILNFSYRGDLAADRADIARLASDTSFAVLRDGTRDFRLWDGVAFLFAKTR